MKPMAMNNRNPTELRRIQIQATLDSNVSQQQRNRMGQFATPPELALQMLRYAGEHNTNRARIRFLDPGIGTGAFYSALLSTAPRGKVESGHGYEIDRMAASAAKALWSSEGLRVHHKDFTTATPPTPDDRFNLVICNPPYVRHHHIGAEKKRELKDRLDSQGYMELNGLAGLYAYFIGLTHSWMAQGALAGWLIPSEFMDVNYGKGIRDYLTSRVTLLHIHRFDPEESQFEDALVSSAIIWLNNRIPPQRHTVRMTSGGTLVQPLLDRQIPLTTLRQERKWSGFMETSRVSGQNEDTLSDLFDIKRGIATGSNKFFVLTEQEAKERGLPGWTLKPLLPRAKALKTDVIASDPAGMPQLGERLFLLDCDLDEEIVAGRAPELVRYLKEGQDKGVNETYLCSRRNPWYSQEKRPPAPFLCTYMGRIRKDAQTPFRFILNHSEATALNVYLMMYPKGHLATHLANDAELKTAIWEALNGIESGDLIREGRVSGGGLRKLEPKELGRVGAQRLLELCNQ